MSVFIVRRILDSQKWKIELLAQAGFHGKYIAECASTPGRQVSVSTVYRVCKEAKIRLRDYRDGIGPVAKSAIGGVKIEMSGKQALCG